MSSVPESTSPRHDIDPHAACGKTEVEPCPEASLRQKHQLQRSHKQTALEQDKKIRAGEISSTQPRQ